MRMDNFGRPLSNTNLLSVGLTIELHHAPAENCIDKKKNQGHYGTFGLASSTKTYKLYCPKLPSDPTVSFQHAAEQQENEMGPPSKNPNR